MLKLENIAKNYGDTQALRPLSLDFPAAGLALFVQGLFEMIERWLIPRGLKS